MPRLTYGYFSVAVLYAAGLGDPAVLGVVASGLQALPLRSCYSFQGR